MDFTNRRLSKVIELYFSNGGSTLMREVDLTLEGFLILDDDWIDKTESYIANERTGKIHKILEHKVYSRTEYKNIPYSGGCLPGSPIKRDYTLLKVTNQEQIITGDFVRRLLLSEIRELNLGVTK